MPVTDIRKDPAARTMTVTAHVHADVERAWQLWADSRQLERWWGPPAFPATFTEHDLRPGGGAAYVMTGPEGEQPRGWWRFVAVDAPRHLELEDGFADEQGQPNGELPVMRMVVDLAEHEEGGTRMTITTTFPSVEAMEQLTAMGMEEGMREALGQIDALVAV